MNLTFKQTYKSIDAFQQVKLNNLTVLTGINGSGKTQLLEAIKAGNCLIDDIQINEIVYFDYRTFYAENEQEFTSHQITLEKQSAWQKIFQPFGNNTIISKKIKTFKDQLGDDYKTIIQLSPGIPLLKLEREHFKGNDLLYNKYLTYKTNVYSIFDSPHLKGHQENYGIRLVAEKSLVSLDEISEAEFKDTYRPVNLKNDFIPFQLSKVFLDYKFKEYDELIIKKGEAKAYEEEVEINNEEDFIKKYGPKPWRIIEEILYKFETFDYTINNPEEIRFRYHTPASFSLTLKHKTKGISIPFVNLSSGEKILFALVLSIYKSLGDGIFPKLILLDEIDASLHPSMIKNLLDVIRDVFLLENQVKVILASHSPTTIALSEEEWIYVINKTGDNKIEKQSKKIALNILSEGFITLEEGLQIFDQFCSKELTIFTEGNNVSFIKKAIELLAPELVPRIKIVDNLKDRTGKTQLKTLFDFFTKMPHENKVLFVYDCDVETVHHDENKTFAYILRKNNKNIKVTKGIENLFPIECFKSEFYPVKEKADGGTQSSLDKLKFEKFILTNGTKEIFENFNPLIERIEEILKI